MDCAQDTAAAMDKAVKDILDECYRQAVKILEANRDDMEKVVAYLVEKETITGGEMVAILEGRDPATAEDPYASDRPREIEAQARHVHMISQKIEAPEQSGDAAGAEPGEHGAPGAGANGEHDVPGVDANDEHSADAGEGSTQTTPGSGS